MSDETHVGANVIPVAQARRTLSRLVQRAAAGETVLIGQPGHAVARLTSVDSPALARRRLGFLKGELVLPEDFDAPLPERLLSGFEGGA